MTGTRKPALEGLDPEGSGSALFIDPPAPKASSSGPKKRPTARRELSVEDYVQGVLNKDLAIMSRAITMVESRNLSHQLLAQEMLLKLLPHAGGAKRVGISGVPGVGKSTFIEAFGRKLTNEGHHVAVLAVDPSSSRTGGSILGDKTRMAKLSADPKAFIRPSPSAGRLGGVARATRETMVICEAAGFDILLIETVGTGQSETMVADMVDFFLVLMLAGSGDELQGIKKGILELADMIVVNKADGDNERKAQIAARDYANALHLMTAASAHWNPPVLTCSAMKHKGLDDIWDKITDHWSLLTEHGEISEKRQQQQIRWMWSMVEDRLMDALKHHPKLHASLPEIEKAVSSGHLTPTLAVGQILTAFGLNDPLKT